MIAPILKKNDSVAYGVIATLSVVVFAVVVALGKFKLVGTDIGFPPHYFATANAVINSMVTLLLVIGLYFVKQKNYIAHKNTMMFAMVLSSLFLVSYIMHHLLTYDTHFGGEGFIKYIYYFILLTHIPLAAIVLPFILLSTYRGLTSDFAKHKKIVRYTFPIWLYVSITGVLVYIFISPYYSFT
jgi:putative membrane protein